MSFRTRYASTDTIDPLGSMTISLKRYPGKVLFQPLVVAPMTPLVKIPYSDFRDLTATGFHSAAFKNFDTQVISAVDNQLENATS